MTLNLFLSSNNSDVKKRINLLADNTDNTRTPTPNQSVHNLEQEIKTLNNTVNIVINNPGINRNPVIFYMVCVTVSK